MPTMAIGVMRCVASDGCFSLAKGHPIKELRSLRTFACASCDRYSHVIRRVPPLLCLVSPVFRLYPSLV